MIRHQGAPDQDALSLALRKVGPRAVRQFLTFNLFEESKGSFALCTTWRFPTIDDGLLAASDNIEAKLIVGDHLSHAGTDKPDLFSQFAPIRFPVLLI